MYIGARYVPIFADPVEWNDEREYEPLTIVIHNGDCYTSKCYVPKGAQLPPYPEGQTKYWVKTSDYNGQFADLKKTVLDLSRLVEQFQKDNEHFTDLINGWNEKVTQWEKDMAAWGERLDTVESNVADLTASLNAEIARAKAAEQANAAAIAKETTDRKQAISELDAAYKAADAAEAQARADADTALSNRITANKTDIDALKAEQAIQNSNISKNAKNISDNAAEIAKHAERLTSLESNASDWDDAFPDTTIAQEVQKEELARANGDKALNGRCDTIAADVEEVRDLANHKVDTTTYTEGQAAQDARITALEGDNTTNKTDIENIKAKDTAQDAAIQQNKDAIANVTGSLSGYVKTETYTAGQAAQDTKINAAQNAANKANTNIGDWETEHPGQTISQCATSLENETAANAAKADANAAVIGDWNTQHPGKTIAQAVTDVSGDIPDVSGFVTKTTYNQEQAAQDAKITAAKAAADKANASIGDWDAQHPGKTIAQAVTDVSSSIPDVSEFVTETTYNQGQAAQDAAISGKADKITSFTAVVYPHFMCAHEYQIPRGANTVKPDFSLIAYVCNPYITANSHAVIMEPTLSVSFHAFGYTPAEVSIPPEGDPGDEKVYNIAMDANTQQLVHIQGKKNPAIVADNGIISIDFTNLVDFTLVSPITEDINRVSFSVYTSPIRVVVTL
jgi:chromosome segregation ATPase